MRCILNLLDLMAVHPSLSIGLPGYGKLPFSGKSGQRIKGQKLPIEPCK